METPAEKPISDEEPELELYTIPSYSSWFSWDNIHEIEKTSLKEFFDGSSMTRTPKMYKEYRDFVITKYREDPSRRLTFTEIRKSLVGDVNYLHKVFMHIEKWGLINFGAPSLEDSAAVPEDENWKVQFEEGAPNGIRVVTVPNSLKVVSMPPPSVRYSNGEMIENGYRMPPLTSYSDVFGSVAQPKKFVCGQCGEHCESQHYKSTKGNCIICVKCFENGSYGETESADDLKLTDSREKSSTDGSVWTETETLLLLESILKHGDDWELVAQNIQTKTKLDCISRLIQLPFGELMLGSAHRTGKHQGPTTNDTVDVKEVKPISSESQEKVKEDDQYDKQVNENEQIGDIENQEPPVKKQRVVSLSDASSSLMQQVALLSTMVDPHITAAAADAAVSALCDENPCAQEIFFGQVDVATNGFGFPNPNDKTERDRGVEASVMEEIPVESETKEASSTKDVMLQTLRIRAAIATALGASAAHAKLLADQEEREIEQLVATIIELQMKKVNYKTKHLEDMEVIMEKEYTEIEKQKESMIAERMEVLRSSFTAGICRSKDHASLQPLPNGP